MRIVIDCDLDSKGNVLAEHVVHTEINAANLSEHPDGKTGLVDVIQVLKYLHDHPELHEHNGWAQITKLTAYPGKTRFEVYLAEIVRMNDVEARKVHGV
jgi:hypothetical protein